MLEQLTTLNELHNKVYTGVSREDLLHRDDEGVLNLKQNQLFNFKGFERFMLQNDILTNTFHCELLVTLNIFNEVNFSKCASTDMLYNFVVFEFVFLNITL